MGKLQDKINDIKNDPQKGFLRFAIFATAVFLIVVGFIRDNNVVRWVRAGIEIRQQNRQIERLKKEISEMDKQVKMLSTERDTLEEFSRETFYFAAPGDDVYVLEK